MIALLVPKLSMTMEEATVLSWLVEDGATVSEGQDVVEIETDKAQAEVQAPADGTIRLVAVEGMQVPVEQLLAEIYAPGEAISEAGDDAPSGGTPASAGAPPIAASSAAAAATSSSPAVADPTPARAGVSSPAARRAARQLSVDLAGVTGTGPRGRITVADVEATAASGAAPSAPTPAPASAPPASAAAVAVNGAPTPAASGLRAAVVANIGASWREIPHVHISGELVADGLVAARALAAQRLPMKVTATDLLILAMAQALEEVPELNGTVGPDGAPRRSVAIDLDLAVAAPDGVVAPALRDVGRLRLAGIAAERARLVQAARAGELAPRDLAGGTATLSNLGAYPVDFFAPVISGPQIATVATGRTVRKPVAIGEAIGLGARLTVNVAIDHRGADGEAGGRLLAALERRIAALPDHV